MTDRALDVGIIAFGVVTLLLVYAFFIRVGSPRPDATRVYNPNDLLGEIIQVEVHNGNGVSGLAGQMTEFLRSYGFDVVEHGDHTSFDQEETIIFDRIGNLDAAKQVALALGIPEASIRQDVRTDYYLDVSVIIGMDYESVMPFVNEDY
ncbi:MAG: hypothetical protein BMS9Abin05_2419 [Rhodothermia bacterium]|nr:MAG: hypothetical protein BMS9Abin05_2419 [Rhodothermia bacterium]